MPYRGFFFCGFFFSFYMNDLMVVNVSLYWSVYDMSNEKCGKWQTVNFDGKMTK